MRRSGRLAGRPRRRSSSRLVASLVAGCGTTGGAGRDLPAVDRSGPARRSRPRSARPGPRSSPRSARSSCTLRDTQTPYRPAEGPLLANAPRAVYQVILPEDPDKGYIVVYEFPDPGRAAEAAAEQQRVPRDRARPGPDAARARSTSSAASGPTVVVYDWLPEDAKDASAPGIQRALETLGRGLPRRG